MGSTQASVHAARGEVEASSRWRSPWERRRRRCVERSREAEGESIQRRPACHFALCAPHSDWTSSPPFPSLSRCSSKLSIPSCSARFHTCRATVVLPLACVSLFLSLSQHSAAPAPSCFARLACWCAPLIVALICAVLLSTAEDAQHELEAVELPLVRPSPRCPTPPSFPPPSLPPPPPGLPCDVVRSQLSLQPLLGSDRLAQGLAHQLLAHLLSLTQAHTHTHTDTAHSTHA